MANKNHICIDYLPAIRNTSLNLDADVIFVPKREIGDELHYVLICPVLCNDHHNGWIKNLYRKFIYLIINNIYEAHHSQLNVL